MDGYKIAKRIIINLLTWLGGRVGLNLIYLVKNGNWVSLRFFAMALGGFLLSFFFANYSSKEILGQYQLVLSVLSLVSFISFLGLNTAALEAVVKGREAGVLKASKIIFLLSLLGVPIMSAIGIFYIFIKHEIILGQAIIMTGVLFPLYYASSPWNVYYEGKTLFKESSLRIIALNIILTLFLIVGIMLKLNAFWLVAVYLAVNIFFQSAYLLEISKKIENKYDNFIDIKFGLAVSVQKAVSGLASSLPPLVISFFFGLEMLAIYYIAYYVISAVSSFMSTLITLYSPILFKAVRLNHKNILFNNLFAGIIIWAIFFIFLKLFFIRVYGAGYSDSLKLAYAISFLVLLLPVHTYLVSFFSLRKKNSFLIATFCLANVIGFLTIFFGKSLGFFWGVALYLYVLEIATVLPLLFKYVFSQKD